MDLWCTWFWKLLTSCIRKGNTILEFLLWNCFKINKHLFSEMPNYLIYSLKYACIVDCYWKVLDLGVAWSACFEPQKLLLKFSLSVFILFLAILENLGSCTDWVIGAVSFPCSWAPYSLFLILFMTRFINLYRCVTSQFCGTCLW